MKGYVIFIAYEPWAWSSASSDVRQNYFDAHARFSAYVAEHGREVASAALADSDVATTLRRVDGELVVTDGPFAETVEMIGGYYEVELPDLDTAIEAAALLPESYTLEIRPVIEVA
jgi:hypothetical protein